MASGVEEDCIAFGGEKVVMMPVGLSSVMRISSGVKARALCPSRMCTGSFGAIPCLVKRKTLMIFAISAPTSIQCHWETTPGSDVGHAM